MSDDPQDIDLDKETKGAVQKLLEAYDIHNLDTSSTELIEPPAPTSKGGRGGR